MSYTCVCVMLPSLHGFGPLLSGDAEVQVLTVSASADAGIHTAPLHAAVQQGPAAVDRPSVTQRQCCQAGVSAT